jgi:hypothetical protein
MFSDQIANLMRAVVADKSAGEIQAVSESCGGAFVALMGDAKVGEDF